MKWVLIQGNGNYSIGTFDGTEFKEETARYACDIGPTFYATQTWGNTDTGDGRRIQAAWMRDSTFPEMPFNQQVSFPCELTLRSTAFADPKSYFHRYARLSDEEATETATSIWNRINLVNLRENILPTRQRADLILKKSENHQIEEVALRRL